MSDSVDQLNKMYGSGPSDQKPKNPPRNFIYIVSDQFNADNSNKMYRYMGEKLGWEEILPAPALPVNTSLEASNDESPTPPTDDAA